MPEPLDRRQFASDNYAGIAPEAWNALADANRGHAPAYGEDDWTAAAANRIRELFDHDADVYFTATGSAANSLVVAHCCAPYQAVICHRLAHIETDECGAPEFFAGGTKVLTCDGAEAKVTPAAIREVVERRSDVHYPRPQLVSLTMSTEVGTCYQPEEVSAIGATARDLGLRLHVDGARFANAVASLGCSPADLTWRAGVDALVLGGSKNGIPFGEAVVFFDRQLSEGFAYRCKQAGQLISKMRFLSAPWLGLLANDAWLHHAGHANAMAKRLADGLARLAGITPMATVEANAVFVELGAERASALHQRGWRFYTFIGNGGARFMCAWDTSPEDVDALLADLAAL